MLRIELKAAASGQPGYGELTLHGWAASAENVELCIQRNQDGRYLDAAGTWDTQPTWHALDELSQTDKSLSGEVGPWLIDPLLLDPQMAYLLQLRNPEASDKGVLRIVGNLLSSQAAGNSLREEGRAKPQPKPIPVPEPEPEPTPELAEEKPEPLISEPVEPEPESLNTEPRDLPKDQKPRRWPWLLSLLVLLIAGAAGAYWWFSLREPESTSTPATAPTAVPIASNSAPCTREALQDNPEDLAFIQTCLKGKPSSEQVLEVINTAKQAKRCGVVQRLYAYQAQSGDALVAAAYAREYDPQSFQAGGCIPSADAETAVYWYEIALAKEANNPAISQRVAELKKAGGQP